MRARRSFLVVVVFFVLIATITPGIPSLADYAQTAEHGAQLLWHPPYDLTCAGIRFAMWESGGPWSGHAEFQPMRVTLRQGSFTDHATHAAGTIIAAGLSPTDPLNTRGICFVSTIDSWTSAGAATEYVSAAQEGFPIANNSWGSSLGYFPSGTPRWTNGGGQEQFGTYSANARSFDDAIRTIDLSGRTLVVVFAAGDDRADGPGATNHDGTWYPSYPDQNPYFDCIDPQATGKNTITVGSTSYGFMTPYSCWGPTDDGRIKPDIVAHGNGIYSPHFGGNPTYHQVSGTEFAAPAVSGVAGLAIQQFQRLYGANPTTAEVKALLLNWARDRGPFGPDYLYGFGYLDGRAAVNALLADGGDRRMIKIGSLGDTATQLYDLLVSDSTKPMELTLTWIDPPGTEGVSPALVNDLDILLHAPGGGLHWPWRLSLADPTLPAVADGPNAVDTVEQVYVASPQTGLWQVEVSADLTVGTQQGFALVSTHALNAGAAEPVNIAFARDGASVDISWDPVADPDLVGWRVFRSEAPGLESELLAVLPPSSMGYTDSATPPVALLAYDVRAVYAYAGAREISVRPFGRQTATPRIVTPRHGSTGSSAAPTRIIGFAPAGSTVTLHEDPLNPSMLGVATADSAGVFWLDHTFGTPGVYDIFAQATATGLGVSIPSLENRTTLGP